jgi:hypothetical protein
MGWKKMIFGEKMPDKNDPKYKDRYEREVEAGRKFARMAKLDSIAADVQGFANGHKKLFLAIVFSLVALSFGFNIVQMVRICQRQQIERPKATAIQHQEHLLEKNNNHVKLQRHEDNRQD